MLPIQTGTETVKLCHALLTGQSCPTAGGIFLIHAELQPSLAALCRLAFCPRRVYRRRSRRATASRRAHRAARRPPAPGRYRNPAQPGEILVEGERIRAVGTSVEHPQGAKVIDLGDATLLPGLIDAHVHLFLHPGAEDLQTVEESVPWRTILAEQAAKADLLAGFTAERDMGTEGAGSADTAMRDAINQGLIPGPRLRISGNAIDILGGHEDAIHYNPAQHVLSNADYANSTEQLVAVMRAQHKEGSDFAKIYETGPDRMIDGESAHALPIHRGATGRRCRGSAPPGYDASASTPWASRARSTPPRPA